jgi:hypothetical protein
VEIRKIDIEKERERGGKCRERQTDIRRNLDRYRVRE